MYYLPWYGSRVQEVRYRKKIYSIGAKKCQLSEIGGIHSRKPSFFSILTPKGTVNMFIQALRNDSFEEAKSFILPALLEGADIEGLKEIFTDDSQYLCYRSKKDENTISVALEGMKGAWNVVDIKMVREQNTSGKWKICEIIRE